MRTTITRLSTALILLATAAGSTPPPAAAGSFHLESTIAFVSTRDNPGGGVNAAEIYLMNADGTNQRRLTNNTFGDGFPVLSPDGKKIVFDSNRLTATPAVLNNPDVFLMNTDGSEQTPLTRGGSASWSPDSKDVVFHRSASGTGLPTDSRPGASTVDSAIFVANVDGLLPGFEQPTNITNNQDARDDDPDWSPASQQIIFTRHDADDLALIAFSAELWAIGADGTGLKCLTCDPANRREERSPDWSPDGKRLAFSCNTSGTMAGHEICVMSQNPDGTWGDPVPLTSNTQVDLSPSWSPDGERIAFQRQVSPGRVQIWSMNANGTDQQQLTIAAVGTDLSPNWGELRVKDPKEAR